MILKRLAKCPGRNDMSNTWVILDCNYLCYRAFYSTGGLTNDGEGTGTLFGFMRDLLTFQNMFHQAGTIACWDVGEPLRKHTFPGYKSGRHTKELDDDEKEAFAGMRRQTRNLRLKIMPSLGYKNIWYKRGYESDDLMAVAAKQIPTQDIGYLVTCDKDLYSGICRNVSFYNPIKDITLDKRWFRRTHGIKPTQWAEVKAIAGCSSDSVPGVKGVGEVTAIKFLRGELKSNSVAYQSILASADLIKRNLELTFLPYPGTPVKEIVEDEMDVEAWTKICEEYGMESLVQKTRKRKKRTLLEASES